MEGSKLIFVELLVSANSGVGEDGKKKREWCVQCYRRGKTTEHITDDMKVMAVKEGVVRVYVLRDEESEERREDPGR